MGKFFESIPSDMIPWIQAQQCFWVATAPLSPEGHINLSPKGIDGTFHVMDNRKCWYEDLTGSGVETVSHLRENGRITVLFNAFVGSPRICRLFGTGTVYEIGSPEYEALLPPEKRKPGSRAIIMIDVHKVGTSCGYAVPLYQFQAHRNTLMEMASKKELKDRDEGEAEPGGMRHYWRTKNVQSIDGLPGLVVASKVQFPLHNTWIKATPLKVSSSQNTTVLLAVVCGFIAGCVMTSFSFFLART